VIHILYFSEKTDELPHHKGLKSLTDIQVTLESDIRRAGTLLKAGWHEICLIWLEQPRLRDLKSIEELREWGRDDVMIVVLTPPVDREWEYSALQRGADLVLENTFPLDGLERVLRRMGGEKSHDPDANRAPSRENPVSSFLSPLSNHSALSLFRDVSRALSDSTDYRKMTEQFVLQLRDLVGIRRVAIFLELPAVLNLKSGREARGLMPCAAAFGIASDLKNCLVLSRHSGLGRRMLESPVIVHAQGACHGSQEAQVRKEIEVPGGVVALPINDREGNLGVAILGERLTGPLQDEELQLLSFLLEELGVAIRNCWLQRECFENKQLLDEMFRSLKNGCLVVGDDGKALHANDSFRKAILGRGMEKGEITVGDLPEVIRKKVNRVREENVEEPPFTYVDEREPDRIHLVTLIPLGLPLAPPRPVLLVIEDITHFEREKEREIQSTRDALTGVIAKRFAHEIRNSLVSLNTHLQLFDTRAEDGDFLRSLKKSLEEETYRIGRFADQMLYYSPRERWERQDVELLGLVRSVAESLFGKVGAGQVDVEAAGDAVDEIWIQAEEKTMRHAFHEVLLNARQVHAEGEAPRMVIRVREDSLVVEVHVLDRGPGLDPEQAGKAFQPFYTGMNTGIGLGLPVARKIVEEHEGTLSIEQAPAPYRTDVVFQLPYTKTVCRKQSSNPVS